MSDQISRFVFQECKRGNHAECAVFCASHIDGVLRSAGSQCSCGCHSSKVDQEPAGSGDLLESALAADSATGGVLGSRVRELNVAIVERVRELALRLEVEATQSRQLVKSGDIFLRALVEKEARIRELEAGVRAITVELRKDHGMIGLSNAASRVLSLAEKLLPEEKNV